MAGIVDAVKQSTSSSNTLASLIKNPMFSELQITLANECAQAGVPFSLALGEESSNISSSTELIVEEATLQAEFKQLAPLRNNKVTELEQFYNTQHVALVTQRTDAMFKLQMAGLSQEQMSQELATVGRYYDTQQAHLTHRISRSLQLLKKILPADTLVTGTRQRAKSRLLNNNAVRIMSEWYQQHMDHPYPTEEEKHQMAAAGNIGVPQVKAWFANKRNRTLNTKPKRQQLKLKQQLSDICHNVMLPIRTKQEPMESKGVEGAFDDLAWLVATTIQDQPDATAVLAC